MKSKLLFLLVVLLSLSAAHAQTFEYDGLTYTVLDPDAKTVSCTGYVHTCLGELKIPEIVSTLSGIKYTVVEIGDHAFDDCSQITSVKFPNTLTSIGSGAFVYCSGLTTLEFPNTLTTIQLAAFRYCTGLASITLPDTLSFIGNQAFEFCEGLTSIVLPSSLSYLGVYAFNCSNITSVTYLAETPITCSIDAFPLSIYGQAELHYPTEKENLYLHTSPWGEFLTSFVAGEYTFNITDADKHYVACTACIDITLDKLNIPSTVIYENQVFTVTSIREYAFLHSSITSVILPESLLSVGDYAFYGCDKLPELILPNTIEHIGVMSFSNCQALTTLTLPTNIRTIAEAAFSACLDLYSITIPEGIIAIDQQAWIDCHKIEEITYLSTNPIEAPENIFDQEVYRRVSQNGGFKYPMEARDQFLETSPWKYFIDVNVGIDEVLSPVSATTEIFDLQGVKRGNSTEGLPAGTYLVRRGGQTEKIAIK